MGTRHLILASVDGQTKLAQYGQWDGYPEGQGVTVIKFLHATLNTPGALAHFTEQLRRSRFLTDEDIDQKWVECGAKAGAELVGMDVADRVKEKYPALSRDTGAHVLSLISEAQTGLDLKDTASFAGDSLFCEWAYLIDLDRQCLEIYKGFNVTPLGPDDRFFPLQDLTREGDYYPIRKVCEFSFDALPEVEEFSQKVHSFLPSEDDEDLDADEDFIPPSPSIKL